MRPKRQFFPGMNQTYARPFALNGKRRAPGKMGDRSSEMLLNEPSTDERVFDGRRRAMSQNSENHLHLVYEVFDEGVLGLLSPRQLQCFTDVIISDDTYEVVAKRYHLSRGAVQGYVRSAAQKIRREIEKRNG